jgi:hypothetical protein
MTGITKGDAQRASNLRPRCVREIDPKTTTYLHLSIYLLLLLTTNAIFLEIT